MKKKGEMYKIREEILWKVVDGEAVVVNPESDNFFYFNKTGTAIWELLAENYGVEEILEKLSKKYKTSQKKIQKDFEKFVEDLRKKELINEG